MLAGSMGVAELRSVVEGVEEPETEERRWSDRAKRGRGLSRRRSGEEAEGVEGVDIAGASQ